MQGKKDLHSRKERIVQVDRAVKISWGLKSSCQLEPNSLSVGPRQGDTSGAVEGKQKLRIMTCPGADGAITAP